ncbi:anaphase-promoting complex subunit 4-like isoform X2 [Lytechinus pictus]|uniref:anaphase-promoting complex subunit 4-like isoform X2 n=1 Tax=Lytechinus pictus TaxID=7653 RepID=UPI0030B9B0BF
MVLLKQTGPHLDQGIPYRSEEATGSPTMQQSFRQLEERNLSVEVTLMQWSPKMDLIALANENGEVLLQRLTWQRQAIWTLTPPGEDEGKEVRALAWRPDGKVLAVGYQSGRLLLCRVEKAEVIHTTHVDQPITCMQWTEALDKDLDSEANGQSSSVKAELGVTADAANENLSEKFLPKLPSLSKISSIKSYIDDNVEDAKKLKEQKRLNMLAVGCHGGTLTLLAFGVAPIVNVDMSQFIQTTKCGDFLGASLSSDLHTISIIVEYSNEEDITEIFQSLLTLDCVLLASRHQEISRYAKKFGKIRTLMEYLEATLKAVTEAKEDILIEMENKLTKYAQQKPTEESLSDEFLQLLLWGKASPELQQFLVHDLTEKGLKKLDQSVENSYVSIQKLVLKHIHSVGRSLLFQLSELKGMALWYDKYGMLGLSATAIQDAINAVGSFMLKANELLQVIESSLKNFKAFFRWLYVIVMQLMEEPIQQSISKMYQRDINFVADFLAENFTDEPSLDVTKSGFTLERVGQYLRKEDLQFPVTTAPNSWQDFVASTPSLRDSDLLFPWQRERSLSQLHDVVKDAVDHALSRPQSVGGESLTCRESFTLDKRSETDEPEYRTLSQQSLQDQSKLLTVFMTEPAPTRCIFLTRQNTKPDSSSDVTEIVQLTFGTLGSLDPDESVVSLAADSHMVLDAAFYGDHSLSLLLQEVKDDESNNGKPVLCQLSLMALQAEAEFIPMSQVKGHLSTGQTGPSFDAGPLVTSRRMDNMRAGRLAVSGSRKVACVLFSNQRRVRLFDMDAEDEGDDEEDDDETQLEDTSMVIVEDNGTDN